MTVTEIVFDPLISWGVIFFAATFFLALLIFCAWRGLSGWIWRMFTAAALLLAISNPMLQWDEKDRLNDIVLVAVDQSASQKIADRDAQTQTALSSLMARLSAMDDLDVQQVFIADGDDNSGTLAMTTIAGAVADIPKDQLAGVILLSDGQVHDTAFAPNVSAPMHLLLSGRETDWDRRLIVENAPAFAILGEPVTLAVRVEDQGQVPRDLPPPSLSISVDGGAPSVIPALSGDVMELTITLPHGGINVIHLSLEPQRDELTDRNNEAIVQINGVRDRLSVLLVSGEPHPGGRTWRNLLKSDSAVDLVHFTILRPPEKQDGVPVSELSLIAFPTRELFLEKIDEFDLIIFDRYRRRGILPNQYLENIRAYVERGGAVLMAAGPEFASANSLFYSSVGDMMPAAPTSLVIEDPFMPQISELGEKHPVTQGLDREWGRWLRVVETNALSGQTVMTDENDRPLLVLDRVGAGRVAMLASDQAWLWTRGFEGGGPQLELLRRLAHWMMKEPELEEEALAVVTDGEQMTVTRRTLADEVDDVEITTPDGRIDILKLTPNGNGSFSASYDNPTIGLYRLAQGDLTTVAALGPSAPKEFEETIARAEPTQHVRDQTGGGALRLEDGVPSIRWVGQGRVSFGNGWIGLNRRDATVTTAVSLREILPAWIALFLIGALALVGWLREGRR